MPKVAVSSNCHRHTTLAPGAERNAVRRNQTIWVRKSILLEFDPTGSRGHMYIEWVWDTVVCSQWFQSEPNGVWLQIHHRIEDDVSAWIDVVPATAEPLRHVKRQVCEVLKIAYCCKRNEARNHSCDDRAIRAVRCRRPNPTKLRQRAAEATFCRAGAAIPLAWRKDSNRFTISPTSYVHRLLLISEIQEWVSELREKKYSPNTVESLHRALTSIFNPAKAWFGLTPNPAHGVLIGRLHTVRQKWALTSARSKGSRRSET